VIELAIEPPQYPRHRRRLELQAGIGETAHHFGDRPPHRDDPDSRRELQQEPPKRRGRSLDGARARLRKP